MVKFSKSSGGGFPQIPPGDDKIGFPRHSGSSNIFVFCLPPTHQNIFIHMSIPPFCIFWNAFEEKEYSSGAFLAAHPNDVLSSFLLVLWTENHLSSFKCGFLNIFSRQTLLCSLSLLLFLPRWNKYGAKKCLKNHIPLDF